MASMMPANKAALPSSDIVRNAAPWSLALYPVTNPINTAQPTVTTAQSCTALGTILKN